MTVEGRNGRRFVFRNLTSSIRCGGDAPWGGNQPRPRLGLAGKGRQAEGKEYFPPVDVVCFNDNWGDIKTEYQLHQTVGISAVDLDQG